MNKKKLADKLGLDWEFAKKVEEIPDFITLEGAIEILDPSLSWDDMYDDYVADKYVIANMSKWIVYGALVNKFGTEAPCEDVDYLVEKIDDIYYSDFEFEFERLGDLYDEVILNLKYAMED